MEEVDALHKKNCDSICYTTQGMLTLMFMKNTCSDFPDSKQVGMPESKQHTMFTNLVSHFSPSVGKFISFNLSPRLIVFQLPFDIMFQSQYV